VDTVHFSNHYGVLNNNQKLQTYLGVPGIQLDQKSLYFIVGTKAPPFSFAKAGGLAQKIEDSAPKNTKNIPKKITSNQC